MRGKITWVYIVVSVLIVMAIIIGLMLSFKGDINSAINQIQNALRIG